MNFSLDKISYSVDQAVTTAEVKRYLLTKNLPTDVELDLVEQIKEAVDVVEIKTRRSLRSASYRLVLDWWPDNCIIPLDRYPLIGVSSVKYRNDTDGSWTPMVLDTDYKVDKYSKPARIIMINTPSLYSDELSKIEIIFSSGYTSSQLIPPMAKMAVKLLVASSFENRRDEVAKGMTKAEKICRSLAIKRF